MNVMLSLASFYVGVKKWSDISLLNSSKRAPNVLGMLKVFKSLESVQGTTFSVELYAAVIR